MVIKWFFALFCIKPFPALLFDFLLYYYIVYTHTHVRTHARYYIYCLCVYNLVRQSLYLFYVFLIYPGKNSDVIFDKGYIL